MKLVAAIGKTVTSFLSTSHSGLESVLWESLDWSWRSACWAPRSSDLISTSENIGSV